MTNHIEWIDHNNRVQARHGSESTVRRLYSHLVAQGITTISMWVDGGSVHAPVDAALKSQVRTP